MVFLLIGCNNPKITDTLEKIQKQNTPLTPIKVPSIIPIIKSTPTNTPSSIVTDIKTHVPTKPTSTPIIFNDIEISINSTLEINKEYDLSAKLVLNDGTKEPTNDIIWKLTDDTLGKITENKLTPLKEGELGIIAILKNEQEKSKIVNVRIVKEIKNIPSSPIPI